MTSFAKQKKPNQKDGKAFQKWLTAELKNRDAEVGKGSIKKDGDAHFDITALEWYRDRLTNPSFVFGKGVAVAWENNDKTKNATHWESKYDASQVPLMQLLEHGTVRDDAMPDRSEAKGKKQVYNRETIAALARFGWAPGAVPKATSNRRQRNDPLPFSTRVVRSPWRELFELVSDYRGSAGSGNQAGAGCASQRQRSNRACRRAAGAGARVQDRQCATSDRWCGTYRNDRVVRSWQRHRRGGFARGARVGSDLWRTYA